MTPNLHDPLLVETGGANRGLDIRLPRLALNVVALRDGRLDVAPHAEIHAGLDPKRDAVRRAALIVGAGNDALAVNEVDPEEALNLAVDQHRPVVVVGVDDLNLVEQRVMLLGS